MSELPGCMIGPSEPCDAFTKLQEERDRLRSELATLHGQHSNVLRENECQRQELATSRKWNQDLLDAARETRPDDYRRAAEWGLAVFADLKKTQKELAEAKAAKRDPCYYRGEQCGAQVELAETKAEIDKMECELIARDKATADMLESRNAALEAANIRIAHMAGVLMDAEDLLGVEETGELITGPNGPINRLIARAERAEAECKAMKALLQRALPNVWWSSLGDEIFAALNPSPAGSEIVK